MTAKTFDEFWFEPVQGGSSYEDVYGSAARVVARQAWEISRTQALQDVASRLVCAAAEPGNEWGRGYAQASKDLAQSIEQLIKDGTT